MIEKPETSEPRGKLRRRRFQFSLRTLLIVVGLLSLPCVYVVHEARIVQERRQFLSEHPLLDLDPWYLFVRHEPETPWLRALLGDRAVAAIGVTASTSAAERARIRALFPEAGVDEPPESVAGIGSLDQITAIHVKNLLESSGIESVIEGSIVYGVFVPKERAEAAKKLLRTDAKERGYWLEFGEKDYQEAVKATPKQIRLPISELLAQPDYAKDKALGRFLRSKELSAELHDYPFVESLAIRRREYLAAKGKTEIGYEVGVVLYAKASDDSKGCEYGYQFFAQGGEVVFQGGSQWGEAPPPQESK